MSDKQEPTTLSGQAYWQEDFRVLTSALQAQEQASKEVGVDCGASSLGSFARWDHDTLSWRTSQLSLTGDLMSFSETWPNAGTMQSGIAYQRHRSAPRTSETDSSLWPTPAASDYKGAPSLKRVQERAKQSTRGVRLPEHISRKFQIEVRGKLNPAWVEWLMGFPIGWTDLDASETQ